MNVENDRAIEHELKQHGYTIILTISDTPSSKHIEVTKGKGFSFDAKIYKLKGNHRAMECYNNEKDILGSVIHPNIAEMFDFFTSKNHAFLIFELCKDFSLETLVSIPCSCTEKSIYGYISQIIHGISHLHANSIAHNNINPSNIMFDRFGRIKIVDFDHSIFTNDQPLCSFTGTTRFPRAPESLNSKLYDPIAADIWGFGAVSYFLLSGEYPWSPELECSYSEAITNSIKKIYGKFDEKLIQLIVNCLSENPTDRPSSAAIHSYLSNSATLGPLSKKCIKKQSSNVTIPKIKRISSNTQFRVYSSSGK